MKALPDNETVYFLKSGLWAFEKGMEDVGHCGFQSGGNDPLQRPLEHLVIPYSAPWSRWWTMVRPIAEQGTC